MMAFLKRPETIRKIPRPNISCETNRGFRICGKMCIRDRFDTDGILQLHATDNGDKLEYSYLQNGQIQTVSKPNPWGKMCIRDSHLLSVDKE